MLLSKVRQFDLVSGDVSWRYPQLVHTEIRKNEYGSASEESYAYSSYSGTYGEPTVCERRMVGWGYRCDWVELEEDAG